MHVFLRGAVQFTDLNTGAQPAVAALAVVSKHARHIVVGARHQVQHHLLQTAAFIGKCRKLRHLFVHNLFGARRLR